MNIHQALAALTLLGTLSTALALMGGAEVEYVRSTSPKMYCGRYLARTLAVVCEQLEKEGMGKRGGSMYNSILSPVYDDQELGWPWIGRLKARTIGSSRGKRGGAVVSECCEKACSYDELVTYC